ncbi:MAG: metalloendopeptidase, partial [Bacteroidales bacterium]|nr:metalloendopeptidase [Bacteroidales bacterium]
MISKRIPELLLLVFTGCLIIYLSANRYERVFSEESEKDSTIVEYIPETKYGIVIDSLEVVQGKIGKNEFLSEILQDYGMPYSEIDKLVRKSKPLFDVRKMRAGNRYTVMQSNDTLQTLQYFIYEISVSNYVVYDFRDSIHIHKGKKEISYKKVEVAGVINSSLWNAMVDNGTDPNLANELSEIFAWAIDFFGLQKGDSYKAIYDELYVEDEYVGIGGIDATLFNHAGRDFYAFYFEQDSVGDYFDEEANSLRRTFLKAPLKFSRISSGFSYSRLHPIL